MTLKRYTRKEMGDMWSLDYKYQCMLEVEKAVAFALGELNIIPKKIAGTIFKEATFSLPKILKREEVTRHDVKAFVDTVSGSLDRVSGGYVHCGLTSSDVLDTGLALQIQKSGMILNKQIRQLQKILKHMALHFASTPCVGRTHGMHAEPITFGWKWAGFYMEHLRNTHRINAALKQLEVGKISGATGTYSNLSPGLETKVCQMLKLNPEPIATQVVPRDRHAELILSFGILAGGLERMALELRHLSRSEVGEVSEGFSEGQVGSSAMPHKKNPILCENISGLCRMIRSLCAPALENISLWHERDISHSSVERHILPLGFCLTDFAVSRMTNILKNIKVNVRQMKIHMEHNFGSMFSSRLLTALVLKGLPMNKAWKHVQSLSFKDNTQKNPDLRKKAKNSAIIKKYLNEKELNSLFSFDAKKLSFLIKEKLKKG